MTDDDRAAEHVLATNRLRNRVINTVPYGEPKMKMNDDMSAGCDDHCSKFAGKPHPDAKHVPSHVPDHKRGAGGPAHHTKGKMRAQLNPDHGPHR